MVEASIKPTAQPMVKVNRSRRKTSRNHQAKKKQPKAQKCVACKKTKATCTPAEIKLFRSCSRCNTVSYCSRECARVHWPDHKPNCKEEKFQNPKNYREAKAKKKQRDLAEKIITPSTSQTPSPLSEFSSVDISSSVDVSSASSASSSSDDPSSSTSSPASSTSSPNLDVRSLALPVRSFSIRWARGPEHPDAVGFGVRKGSTTDSVSDSHDDEAALEVLDPAGLIDSGSDSQDETTSKALPDLSDPSGIDPESDSDSRDEENASEALPNPSGSSQENNSQIDNRGSKNVLSVHAKVFEPEQQLVYAPAFVFVPVWLAPPVSSRGKRRRKKKRSRGGESTSKNAVAIR